MKIYETYANLGKSMRINENWSKSIKKSMKNNEKLWKSTKFMTYMGCICFEQRRLVIFHVLNIYTPHISALQREINCLNRENWNLCFQGNMSFDLQITYQSHIFYENLKWSHGHYGHFALDDLIGNPDRRSVFDKSVEVHFSKSLGLISGTIFDGLI